MANIDTFDFEKYQKGEYVTYSETLKHSIGYLKGIQDSAGKDSMKDQLQEGIDGIQMVVDKLEAQNEYNPQKFLGFRLDEEFFASVMSGLSTCVFFIINATTEVAEVWKIAK